MIAHDPQLDVLVTQGHQRQPRVTAYSLAGEPLGDVPVIDGTVTFDLTQQTGLRSGVLQVPQSWAPTSDTDPLAPFGQYVTIGFEYPGYDTVHLGEFPILGTTLERPSGIVRVTLGDWAYRTDRALAEVPQQYDATLPVADVILTLCQQGAPRTLTLATDGTAGAVIGGDGFTINAGTSPWSAAFDLADTNDCYLYLGPAGDTVHIVSDQITADPIAVLEFGDGGHIVGIDTDINVLTAVNRVVALVESGGIDGETYRAVETLDDGPMAYGDTFGRYPVIVTLRTDNASQGLANQLADYTFTRQAGAARVVNLDIVPMPWLQVADTVRIVTGAGEENVVLEAVTIPLAATRPMSATSRVERTQVPGQTRRGAGTFLGANQ